MTNLVHGLALDFERCPDAYFSPLLLNHLWGRLIGCVGEALRLRWCCREEIGCQLLNLLIDWMHYRVWL